MNSKVSETDLSYSIDVEYDTISGGEAYGREDRITNTRIADVSCNGITSTILDFCFKTPKAKQEKEILRYCVDRLVRIKRLWNPSIWKIRTIGGYYGEEIGTVTLKHDKADDIDKAFFGLESASDKIMYILEQEYGFLLPELSDRTWDIKEVDIDDIRAGSEGQMRKVDQEGVECYKDIKDDPIGIVILKDYANTTPYRLIDGYHRLLAAKRNELKKVNVVIGSENLSPS